jgi:dual specificity phosphatase 12
MWKQFPESNAIIREARQQGKNVLVHCQAGVSRSSTLCAAFLMEELDLTADGELLVQVKSVHDRVSTCRLTNTFFVVQPLEFFLHQLEIFERCNFELDPNKHAAYRRFLMNFNAQEMIGAWSSLLLGYDSSVAIATH